MLKVEDAYFAISGTPIIEGVSFEITKGEIACLLGPSGSGKTSILRLIAGLEALDRGNIFIGDQLVSNKQHNLSPNKRGIGFLFQDYALFPHLTVYQNIAWGIGKTEKDKTEVIVKQLLDRIQMYDQAEKYPHELSGGEQQRVALARAQACQPNLLLLDEPFSGLDTNLRNDIREQTSLILRSDKITSIIVTHDPEEAMT
ncbi:MAG: ABC transporter ATP-binding protein, partial [Nisaea sp.]|nr:ABC transporter ATP-binding protein [Nisaea sp.]